MITTETLRVQASAREVYLAPYGAPELEQHVPLDPAVIPLESHYAKELYARSPESILEEAGASSNVLHWGIYEEAPSPQSFAGVSSVLRQNVGAPLTPRYGHNIQELGALLFSPDRRGKGVGFLAVLATIMRAREVEGTTIFVAQTSEHNAGSKAGLAKLGFACMGHYFPDIRRQEEKIEYWQLATKQGQRALGKAGYSLAEQYLLAEGWERHLAVAQSVSVERV